MGNLIYVAADGEFEIVRELAGGGEELVKVDATAVGYTAHAFRERLGVKGLGDLIQAREQLAGD